MDMEQDNALYDAFKAKDSRFDGVFFVGVRSTGIYCRPICRAKLPKPENCVFFASAAEAEQAGFRPCLICRPELAPGLAVSDAKIALARRAAAFLEEQSAESESLHTLADRLGCSERHLRRVFMEEYHVSPVQHRQTCRLLLAKGLLTDTELSIMDVAMAAGFGSVRRFNSLFQKQYRLSPTNFRKQTARGSAKDMSVCLSLGYRPPYQWERLLHFLAERAIPGVECVENGAYCRTVRLHGKDGMAASGWITVSNVPEKNLLAATLSESLLPVLPQLRARIRKLFDLCCNPHAVYATLAAMNAMRPGLFAEGLRLPGCLDPFELSVRAVLGQQITVKAAGTLAGRLAATFGKPLPTPIPGLTHTYPFPEDLIAQNGHLEERLGELGIIAARTRAIFELANAFVQHTIDVDVCANVDQTIKKLVEIPGIGPWTAQYIAMRAMSWPDAFPATDLGLRKALGGAAPKAALALSEAWKPWRSYATMALWDSLQPGNNVR